MKRNVMIAVVIGVLAIIAVVGIKRIYTYSQGPDSVALWAGDPGPKENYVGEFIATGCECVMLTAMATATDDQLREGLEKALNARKALIEKGQFPYKP